MKLQNSAQHLANTGLLVNGTRYKFDENCVIDASDADAARLIKDKSWHIYREPVPQSESKVAPAAKPEKRVEEKPKVEDKLKPESKAEVEAEWPDPDMTMTLSYLRDMADAYEVKYTKRTQKKALIKLIKKAMYD